MQTKQLREQVRVSVWLPLSCGSLSLAVAPRLFHDDVVSRRAGVELSERAYEDFEIVV